MDAWETLAAGATIPAGDAWELLQAQGGGSELIIVHADGMEVEVSTDEIEVLVDQAEVELLIDQQETYIDIDNTPIEVEL